MSRRAIEESCIGIRECLQVITLQLSLLFKYVVKLETARQQVRVQRQAISYRQKRLGLRLIKSGD
jgi:hypothetical protein